MKKHKNTLPYDPGSHAIYFEDESLTEQEHKDACDINKMIRSAHNGQPILSSSGTPIYGHDDLTIDAVQHRINKQKMHDDLARASKDAEGIDEEVFERLPNDLKKAYTAHNVKIKKRAPKVELKNDDKTTNKKPDQNEPQS